MSFRIGKKEINILPGNSTKTFNLLSIGQRGVGKTVFLIGSYEELRANRLTEQPQKLWFDCQNDQVQENIERILNYVVQTNQYPPPTMKIINFSFSLKRQNLWGEQTLCHFRWNDIPGEICDIHNLEFRNMVLNSHGCCVFIDAYALRYSDAYLQVLDAIFEQVMALTSLVYLNGLNYPLAVILTKSDLLENNSQNQQLIKNKLQPLITHLDAVNANYQIFYSFVPLIRKNGNANLEAKGAAVAILWLVWELNKAHNPSLENHLSNIVNRIMPVSSSLQIENPVGTMQSLFTPSKKASIKNSATASLFSYKLKGSIFPVAMAIAMAGFIFVSLGIYQRFSSASKTTDISTIDRINSLQQAGQLNQAVLLLEQLIQREPERMDLRLRLAQLYELTGDISNAESTYDRILAKDKNNIKALIGKAVLLQVKGDSNGAAALFEQAEKVAPASLKAQIRAVAKSTLQSNPSQLQKSP